MLIRIKAGTASYFDGRKRHLLSPADGAVDVPDAVAKRWVNMGSAVKVEPKVDEDPRPDPDTEPEPEPQVELEGSGAIDYSKMTAKELRSECEARGLDVPPKARKGQLTSILQEADMRGDFPPFEPLEAE